MSEQFVVVPKIVVITIPKAGLGAVGMDLIVVGQKVAVRVIPRRTRLIQVVFITVREKVAVAVRVIGVGTGQKLMLIL